MTTRKSVTSFISSRSKKPVTVPSGTTTVVEEKEEIAHEEKSDSPLATFDSAEEGHWSHSPFIVLLGVIIGLLVAAWLYMGLVKPFLVGYLPTYPGAIGFLVYTGIFLLTLWPIGKIIQHIRTKHHYYQDSTIVVASTDS